MITITSTDNNRIKQVCRLADRKHRKTAGKYVTEGYRNVKDSLPYLINAEIYMSESAKSKYGDEFAVDVLCSDAVFDKISSTENSQGIICVSDIPPQKIDFSKDTVFLDAIADPGNLGTILRSCLATGFENIVTLHGVDCYNPKVVRSAMSAVCKLNVSDCSDAGILEQFKNADYDILCADMDGDNVFDAEIGEKKVCLVIGSEARGISDSVLAFADKIISLPMGKIESLNAAVCASVMMYQIKYNSKRRIK